MFEYIIAFCSFTSGFIVGYVLRAPVTFPEPKCATKEEMVEIIKKFPVPK